MADTASAVPSSPAPLLEAITSFDRSAAAKRAEDARVQRAAILSRFPLDAWPAMTLQRYALGQENSEDTYCRWLEFKTPELGSIKGGNATKLVVYKRLGQPGWFFYPPAQDEEEAWISVRNGFLEMFRRAKEGEFDSIDDIEGLARGPALRAKTLHIYFPDAALPVYSTAHLLHFLRLLNRPEGEENRYDVVRLNRLLLSTLREKTQLTDWSTTELGFFLYHWADPREVRRVVKIAPGEAAMHWNDCLAGGYICVSWDAIGDLELFETEEQFRSAFEAQFQEMYKGHQPTIKKKARELWTLRELEPGDLIVANKGMSQVLGVGTVVEPGYEWNAGRPDFRHTVHVTWDTSLAQEIPPQKRWAFVTVAPIPLQLQRLILSRGGQTEAVPVPAVFTELDQALRRRGQAILYGPPGTGKTFTARQFAVYWLLTQDSDPDALKVLASPHLLKQASKALGNRLTTVTFHPSYAYEDFVEGFRPTKTDSGNLQLTLEPGVFRQICADAASQPYRAFVLLIDEINRANLPKVFGELVTLLEKDKRNVELVLPQSKEVFAIPDNLYVLGTMNTADRSIKLVDVALRRRFAFVELMPDSSLLEGAAVESLALDDFLEYLNGAIMAREGREKQIGHAYLLQDGRPIADPAEFARRFRQEILPLLQEYCYDDYTLLGRLLGEELVDVDTQTFNRDLLMNPDQLCGALATRVNQKVEDL